MSISPVSASNAVLLPVSTKLTPEGSCNTPIVAPASLLMSTFPRSYPRFGKWLCCLFPSYPKSGFDLCFIYFPNLSQIYPGFFGKQAILFPRFGIDLGKGRFTSEHQNPKRLPLKGVWYSWDLTMELKITAFVMSSLIGDLPVQQKWARRT